jgi:GNAT superfamily N-acetyltransferase
MREIITANYVPGSLGRITELHAVYYGKHWGFGLFFEAGVAAALAEFAQHFDPDADGIWTASRNGLVEGSIVIDGAKAGTDGAHLRWFILSDAVRGQGLGNRLLETAIGFCRQKRYPRVYLWTFHGLLPARHLYEKYGFRLAQETEGNRWGKPVLEQRLVLELT